MTVAEAAVEGATTAGAVVEDAMTVAEAAVEGATTVAEAAEEGAMTVAEAEDATTVVAVEGGRTPLAARGTTRSTSYPATSPCAGPWGPMASRCHER